MGDGWRRAWGGLGGPNRAATRVSVAFLEWCIARSKRRGDRRLASGKGRTLWGVTPILTLPLKARCDEQLGFTSESLVFTTYYTAHNFTWNLRNLLRLTRLWPAALVPLHRVILGNALLRYDVFHVFADRGIMPSAERFGIAAEELDALRRAGKRVYVYGYGADVRTRAATLELGTWNFCRDCTDVGRYCVCDDVAGRDIMAGTAKAATALVSQADMLAYMPGAVHLAYWPIDTGKFRQGVTGYHRKTQGPLRIAHAPNHTHFKGTRYLDASVARLRERGIQIELVQISQVANEKVLALFASCDVVADQFIGGAYGFTALEAMALGKPVITYVRDPALVHAVDECPLLNATPDTLDAVLEWCDGNRDQLPKIGRQGRCYVERHHSIAAVAARLAKLYLDTASFPAAVENRLKAATTERVTRLREIPTEEGWHHPFEVRVVIPNEARAS